MLIEMENLFKLVSGADSFKDCTVELYRRWAEASQDFFVQSVKSSTKTWKPRGKLLHRCLDWGDAAMI